MEYQEIVKKAIRLGIIDDAFLQEKKVKVVDDEILSFEVIHEKMCEEGNKIGYINSLMKYYTNGYITDDTLDCLKGTLFYDYLKVEAQEKRLLKRDKETRDFGFKVF